MSIDRAALLDITVKARKTMATVGERLYLARLAASDREVKGKPAPLPYSRLAQRLERWDVAMLQRFEHGMWIPTNAQLDEIMDFIESMNGDG